MPSSIATLVFALGILGLFVLDREREAQTSEALWLPVVWLLISGSRNVSQWLFQSVQVGEPMAQSERYLEGSPVDRGVLTILLALGLIVLVSRRLRFGALLRANAPIFL